MKEIKDENLQQVSGGSLTSDLLNFFRHGVWGSAPQQEHHDWTSGSTITSPAVGKGDEYGRAMVIGLVTIAAIVATGIKAISGKY